MSRKSEVGEYVSRKIDWLAQSEYLARSRLAELRRGAGKEPGEIPGVCGTVLSGMPSGFIGEGGYASKEEWACYTALTLFALHQQGTNIEKKCMNTKDYATIGIAANRMKLQQNDANGEERVFGHLQHIISADSINGAVWYLRSMIQQCKRLDIKVNYRQLAEDLYEWQFPDGKTRISLKWGQDFYRNLKETKAAAGDAKEPQDNDNTLGGKNNE